MSAPDNYISKNLGHTLAQQTSLACPTSTAWVLFNGPKDSTQVKIKILHLEYIGTQEGETEEKIDNTKRHSPEYTENTHAERDCQRQISP
jgi:hypothetical protein